MLTVYATISMVVLVIGQLNLSSVSTNKKAMVFKTLAMIPVIVFISLVIPNMLFFSVLICAPALFRKECGSYVKSLLGFVFTYGFMLIVLSLTTLVYSDLLGLIVHAEDINNDPVLGGIMILIMSISTICFTWSIRRILIRSGVFKKLTGFVLSKQLAYVIGAAATLTCMVIYFLAAFSDAEMLHILVTVIYLALLILIIYSMLAIFNKQLQVEKREVELNQLQVYTKRVETIYNEMRRVKHDQTNVLTSMAGFIDQEDMTGLKDYFNGEIIPYSKTLEHNDYTLGLLSNLTQIEVKGLVANKVITALNKGIKLSIEITEPFEVAYMNMVDLSRVLGILLDNAIEASEIAKSPEIQIGFINHEKEQLIIVANTYKEPLPPLYQLLEEGFSTKGSDRGIGLSNLKDLMDNYGHLSKSTLIEDGYFKQIIKIEVE